MVLTEFILRRYMLRKHILQSYTHHSRIDHTIGRDSSVFIKGMVWALVFLFLLFACYAIVDQYSDWQYIPWIFAGLGFFLFAHYVVSFLNQYLDSIIIWPEWITIFLLEGLLEYKTDYFDRSNIETVQHRQDTLWDKVFSKGDVHITLDHSIWFPFSDVSSPQKQARTILFYRDKYMRSHTKEESTEWSGEQMTVLMEALGEVVQEYVDKKKDAVDNQSDDDYNMY